ILEDRKIPVVDARLSNRIARRIAVVAASRRTLEHGRVEPARQRTAGVRHGIAGHHRANDAETTAEIVAGAAVAAGEIKTVAGRQDDGGPVSTDERVLAREL